MKRYPQGGKIAAITGPANWSGTLPPNGSKASYEIMLKKYPKIEMAQVLSGDFTVEAGLNMAQTILQTHPDAKMLLVQYDQNALGAIQALKTKGKKPGDVMVYGLGCDHSGIDNIKAGWQQGCFLLQPVEETGWAVEAVIAYLSGVKQCAAAPTNNAIAALRPGSVRCIPKFLWTLRDPTLKRAFGPKASPYVTKANVNVIVPEW
jgi:ABC-type sugar transport system substrate-binding protein